ncbi:type I-E CRISPR-associated protein Cas6/Cse3/CasE [Neptuniibacter sp. QD37_11]|uniref:type I-E CRISPR-associated protein Cas6/Cse3/CasE n=1 Tax=Neptuniibacter sp. QD37_11 TaxID=3398209 RepID=UPI0039F45E99
MKCLEGAFTIPVNMKDAYAVHQAVWKVLYGHLGENQSLRDYVFNSYAHPTQPDCSYVEVRLPAESKVAGELREHLRPKEYQFDQDEIVWIEGRIATLKRVDGREILVPEDELDTWATRVFENQGLQLEGVTWSEPELFHANNHKKKEGAMRFSFMTRRYNAMVKVVDPSAAQTAMLKGIGRKRACGTGMIKLEVLD